MENEYIELTEQQEAKLELHLGKIGLCSCGNPYDVKLFIRQLLANQNDYYRNKISSQELHSNSKKIIKNTRSETILEFTLHVLSNVGLLQHGYSVYSSTLTEDGKSFLELLTTEINNSNITEN